MEVRLKTITIKQSVVIHLPAEEVFAYLSEVENLPDWSGPMIAIRKISPGALQVGARMRSTLQLLGRWMDITFEIVEYEPDRYLTIKSLSGTTPCLFCYQFGSLADGGTSVCLEAVIELSEGILGLSEAALSNVARRQIEHDLLTLKDVLEARHFQVEARSN
jgi:uncharacterized membrane protein